MSHSTLEAHLRKAVNCIKELRLTAIGLQEVAKFNKIMQGLRVKYLHHDVFKVSCDNLS